jgi:MFS family permease
MSTTQTGIALSIAGLAGLLFSVPLGRLADRVGGHRMLTVLYVCRGCGFLAYLFAGNVTTVMVVACLLGIGERSSGPVVQTVVGVLEKGEWRVRTMAAMNALRNVGFAIAAALATIVMAAGSAAAFRVLVAANAASFFAAAALITRTGSASRPGGSKAVETRRVRVHDPRYLLLTAFNGVLYLHTVVLTVGLPLWIATRTQAPTALIGAVVVLNTVLAIPLGLRLSRGASGIRAAAARQHWAGCSLAGCCALVAMTGALGALPACILLLTAAVALTLGEIWQSLGAWGLSYALSPESQRSYYLSVYSLGDTGAAIAGPALLTVGVLGMGGLGWLVLAGAFAGAGLSVHRIARRAADGVESASRPKLAGRSRTDLTAPATEING